MRRETSLLSSGGDLTAISHYHWPSTVAFIQFMKGYHICPSYSATKNNSRVILGAMDRAGFNCKAPEKISFTRLVGTELGTKKLALLVGGTI